MPVDRCRSSPSLTWTPNGPSTSTSPRIISTACTTPTVTARVFATPHGSDRWSTSDRMRSSASMAGPERLSADLYLTHWLEQKEIAYDTIADENLHAEGEALLSPYRVVVTGTHPEYWTKPMLDALDRYLDAGGRVMYLGGNGFYWVTGVDPERPHVIEIRRWRGTETWEADPGEVFLSTTGEQGGLWRQPQSRPAKAARCRVHVAGQRCGPAVCPPAGQLYASGRVHFRRCEGRRRSVTSRRSCCGTARLATRSTAPTSPLVLLRRR